MRQNIKGQPTATGGCSCITLEPTGIHHRCSGNARRYGRVSLVCWGRQDMYVSFNATFRLRWLNRLYYMHSIYFDTAVVIAAALYLKQYLLRFHKSLHTKLDEDGWSRMNGASDTYTTEEHTICIDVSSFQPQSMNGGPAADDMNSAAISRGSS